MGKKISEAVVRLGFEIILKSRLFCGHFAGNAKQPAGTCVLDSTGCLNYYNQPSLFIKLCLQIRCLSKLAANVQQFSGVSAVEIYQMQICKIIEFVEIFTVILGDKRLFDSVYCHRANVV